MAKKKVKKKKSTPRRVPGRPTNVSPEDVDMPKFRKRRPTRRRN